MKLVKLFLTAGVLLATTLASATSITYTESAMVSGTLGILGVGDEMSFHNELLTITFSTDTSLVIQDGPLSYTVPAPYGQAYFSIAGASGYFTDRLPSGEGAIRVDVSEGGQSYAGFHDGNPEGGLMITWGQQGDRQDIFRFYDLKSSFGPFTGPSQVDSYLYFGTNYGPLKIDDMGDSTFTARVGTTAEPSTCLLIGTGALGILATVRRRLIS